MLTNAKIAYKEESLRLIDQAIKEHENGNIELAEEMRNNAIYIWTKYVQKK